MKSICDGQVATKERIFFFNNNINFKKKKDYWENFTEEFYDGLYPRNVIDSEEMAIALFDYFRIEKLLKNNDNYILEIFFKNSPQTFVSAIRLASKRFIDYKENKDEILHPKFVLIKNYFESLDTTLGVNIEIIEKMFVTLKAIDTKIEKAYKDIKVTLDPLKTIIYGCFASIEICWGNSKSLELDGDMYAGTSSMEFYIPIISKVMHRLIKEWKKSQENLNKVIEEYNNITLNPKFIEHYMGLLNTIHQDDVFNKIKEIINLKLDKLKYKNDVLSSFQYEHAKKWFISDGEIQDRNNEEFNKTWLENGEKRVYREQYEALRFNEGRNLVHEVSAGDNEYWKQKNTEANINSLIQSDKAKRYYGIENIIIDDKKYDIMEINFLEKLSTYSHEFIVKPYVMHMNNHSKVVKSPLQWVNAVTAVFADGLVSDKNRLPIKISSFDEFIKMTIPKKYKNDNNDENIKNTKELTDYFSVDILFDNEFNLLKTPLIKLGETIISFPHFTAHYNWLTSIVNRTRKKKTKVDYGMLFEKTIVKMLEKLPYDKIITGKKIVYDNKQMEIDIAVQFDDILLLIEVKSTYELSSVKEINDKKQDFVKAGYQLTKLKNYFEADMSRVTLELAIEGINRIETLIVSNSFEFDHDYFNGHLKISFLELEVVGGNLISELIQIKHILPLIQKFEELSTMPNNEMDERIQLFIKKSSELIDDNYDMNVYDNTFTVDIMLKYLHNNMLWDMVFEEKPELQEKMNDMIH